MLFFANVIPRPDANPNCAHMILGANRSVDGLVLTLEGLFIFNILVLVWEVPWRISLTAVLDGCP